MAPLQDEVQWLGSGAGNAFPPALPCPAFLARGSTQAGSSQCNLGQACKRTCIRIGHPRSLVGHGSGRGTGANPAGVKRRPATTGGHEPCGEQIHSSACRELLGTKPQHRLECSSPARLRWTGSARAPRSPGCGRRLPAAAPRAAASSKPASAPAPARTCTRSKQRLHGEFYDLSSQHGCRQYDISAEEMEEALKDLRSANGPRTSTSTMSARSCRGRKGSRRTPAKRSRARARVESLSAEYRTVVRLATAAGERGFDEEASWMSCSASSRWRLRPGGSWRRRRRSPARPAGVGTSHERHRRDAQPRGHVRQGRPT
jgi:hypothetical protein